MRPDNRMDLPLPMLLIITNEADIHPNPVIDRLLERGAPFFRLNTDRLLTDYDVTWQLSDRDCHFEIKYKHANHRITDREISCVWERRPMEPLATYDRIEDDSVRRTILEEADGFVRFLRYALTYYKDLLWIGHPIHERRAGSKILQKLVARDVGFRIPDSLFTNEIKALDPFREQTMAIKPICSFDIPTEDGAIVFYTRKVACREILALGERSFRNNINFLETYIPKRDEWRITVIDGHFFSARIDSQKHTETSGAVDWRQGYDDAIAFVPTDTPQELKQGCLDFLARFDLRFGCFDFIRRPDGEYVFLECNTNGQWLWLEDEGLDISSSLAQIFIEQIEHKRDRNNPAR